jgi:hypothetical protein
VNIPAYETGRSVLGPILARFARDLRLHAGAKGPEAEVALLFCARGGLRMRPAYEAACRGLGIGTGGRTADLMVSRLQAAKVGLQRSPHAVEEFVREGGGRDLREAARLILGAEHAHLADEPDLVGRPVDAAGLSRLLERDDALGLMLSTVIGAQRIAFAQHVAEATGNRGRPILVDTGLFGGTMRILEDVYPEYEWTCALVGRANYRGIPAPHFSRTSGLLFEAEVPSRRRPATALLRHWHLVEGLFEPDLPSATTIGYVPDGRTRSDLEIPGWREKVLARGMPLYDGMMDHLSGLKPSDLSDLDLNADRAERVLARMILRPTARDAVALDVGARSMDFGREGASMVVRPVEGGLRRRIWSVRHSLWREGQIRRAVPLASVALPAFGIGRALLESAPGVLGRCLRLRRRLFSRIRYKGTRGAGADRIVNHRAPH